MTFHTKSNISKNPYPSPNPSTNEQIRYKSCILNKNVTVQTTVNDRSNKRKWLFKYIKCNRFIFCILIVILLFWSYICSNCHINQTVYLFCLYCHYIFQIVLNILNRQIMFKLSFYYIISILLKWYLIFQIKITFIELNGSLNKIV